MQIWEAIVKAVNSNIKKPLDTLISEGTKSVTDRLDNENYGLNAIKGAMEGMSVPAVKSVQRGLATVNMDSSKYYVDVTITNVEPKKTIVIIEKGSFCTEGSYLPMDDGFGYLINDDTIRIYFVHRNAGTPYYLPWQVVEFY